MEKFNKNDIINGLEELYLPVGNQWVMKNSYVINAARTAQLAIGGSIATGRLYQQDEDRKSLKQKLLDSPPKRVFT